MERLFCVSVMMHKRSLGLALLTMLLWGSLFPMVKLGFSAYQVRTTADILLFAGIRFVLCGGIICVFTVIRNPHSYKEAGGAIVPVLLSGLFSIVLHYSCTYAGLQRTDSSKTAILKQVGALIYVCFSFVFIKEDKPTMRKIVAAAVGFLGIVALNVSNEGISLSLGDGLILGASFCTVFSNVISKKLFRKVEPITATGISQLFGGAVLLTVGLLLGGRVQFRADHSLWIMGYICAASIVSYCIWFGIVKNGELSKLFIIKFAEPVFACLFGALILGENIFRLQYLLAFLLISGGILLSHKK